MPSILTGSVIPGRCSRRARRAVKPAPWRTGRTPSKSRAWPSASDARGSVQAALLEKLRVLVGARHLLTGVDLSPYVVEGRTPEAAVFAGTVEEVRAIVALAAEADVPVIAWGGGTASAAGMPAPRAGLVLGLRRLDRILEHEPGDLTVTVEAGRTIADLQSALRERGQWLSLDPPDADRATIGGVIATNASGPRRHLYGTARDVGLGVTGARRAHRGVRRRRRAGRVAGGGARPRRARGATARGCVRHVGAPQWGCGGGVRDTGRRDAPLCAADAGRRRDGAGRRGRACARAR